MRPVPREDRRLVLRWVGPWLAFGALAALLAVLLVPPVAAAEADEHAEAVRRGALTFRIHCQSCHGGQGQGDGPVAGALKVPPPDLTLIAHRAGGIFPTAQVRRKIDGRDPVLSHGPSEMPVWGWTFEARGDRNSEEVDQRIDDLVLLLESWQAPVDAAERSGVPH